MHCNQDTRISEHVLLQQEVFAKRRNYACGPLQSPSYHVLLMCILKPCGQQQPVTIKGTGWLLQGDALLINFILFSNCALTLREMLGHLQMC